MGMTRHEQLSTGWVDESHHGGMLLAVLGHLSDADRDVPGRHGGRRRLGVRRGAGRLDLEPHRARRDPPATAALRGGGWKATTLEHGGSLATSWMELVPMTDR